MITPKRFGDLVAKPVLGLFIASFGSAIGAIAAGAHDAAWLFTGAAIVSALTLVMVGFVSGRSQ